MALNTFEHSFSGAALSAEEWHERRMRHCAEIHPITSKFRERRGRGQLHPIYDFLFTYYRFSSRKLEKWHPGFGVTLKTAPDSPVAELLEDRRYEKSAGGIALSAGSIREREIQQLIWVRSLCKTVAEREPRFSCLGLHEWAMVYRSADVRHDYPLRLSAERIAGFLDSVVVGCSHFDAFRFFTPPAIGLNILQPTADDRIQFEQGGCIHANMDLYKWAFKLSPLISSDLLRECFMLAIAAREIDMRASPYDFASLGFAPIEIETAEGQEEYRRLQRGIADQAAPLRLKLLEAAETVLALIAQTEICAAAGSELPGVSCG